MVLQKFILFVAVAACLTGGPWATEPTDAPADVEPQARPLRAVAQAPVTPFVIDIDTRDLPTPRDWQPGDPLSEVPRRRYPQPNAPTILPEDSVDPLLARQLAYAAQRGAADPFTNPTRNFLGINFTGAGVPDVTGDVGTNHFIQSLNGGTRVRIWNKDLPNPQILSTFNMDSLGTGACANGLGDPVIIFDRNADRWVLMEFVSGGTNLCVYVSKTPNPVAGGWYAYDFVPPSFPDYPKLAVWPTDRTGGDGSYVVTANAGVAVYAMERGPMLQGDPARFLNFNLPSLPGFAFQTATPADIDGPAIPPSGAPAVIMRQRDTESHNGPNGINGDQLEMWALDVDWSGSGSATMSGAPSTVLVTDFSSELCGLTSFSCIQQPGTGTRLDPLREVIMNRLQYMHHQDDGFETLVGNFVVDVSGTDRGGIRWFELRRTGGASQAWTLFQEGTYSIDDDSRWMGGSSMDQSGNIALAYNVSSSTTFPSLRYTGRQATDPLGVMTQPETSIAVGTTASGTNRYGDYSQMGLDPADDCTFWFTGEYNPGSVWQTRIASFRFEQCGCLIEPAPIAPFGEALEKNRIDLSWSDSELDVVSSYSVQRGRQPGGPYEVIATVPDSSPGIADGPGYTFHDEDVDGGIVYYYVIVATDGGPCRSDALNEIAVEAFGECRLAPIFGGLTQAKVNIDEICGILVEWDAATAQCGSAVTYNLYRSTDAGFEPGPSNLVGSGISGSSVVDQSGLISGQEYFYVVRAQDNANYNEEQNGAKDSATVASDTDEFYFFDFEDSAEFAADWTVSTGPGFHRCGDFVLSSDSTSRPAAGSGQYALSLSQDCAELLPATSTKIDSPTFDLTASFLSVIELQADVFFNHFDGDADGTIEVWDGNQWVVVWADPDADVDATLTIDVSPWALGNPAFQVRFNYQDANDDRWFSVDNVRINVALACDPAGQPSAAPDGTGGTQAVLADRLSPDGDALRVTWDASCALASTYNLLVGDLQNVSDYQINSSECAIGNGSFDWTGVPAGDLYFLVVGADADGFESSWGAGVTGERHGLAASGLCGTLSKTLGGECAP